MLARMGYLVVSGNHLYNINVKIKSIGNKSISIKAYRLKLRKQPIEFSGENAGHNNAVNVWLVIPDKLKAIIKNINVSVGQKSYYYRIDAFFKLWKKINYKKQIKDEIAKKKWEANNRSISKYEIYSMPEVSPGRG
jgi:hypothetical protein